MRKGFLMVLAVALVAVWAAPAVAGTDINGFYRIKGYVSNFKKGDTLQPNPVQDDMASGGFVEQRVRLRFSFGEENVKAIWFSEIDLSQWGDSAGNTGGGAIRGAGGALGGDKINLETKNVYVWFKIPDTSLDFAVGLQNQTDNFQGLLYGAADMAGIFATGKYEPVSWKLGWARWYENSTNSWDDLTLYMGSVNFVPTKDVKLGVSLYVFQDDTQKTSTNLPWGAAAPGSTGFDVGLANMGVGAGTGLLYTPGIDFAWNAGPVNLSGFFLYQFGTYESTTTSAEVDVSAFAADLRVDMNLGPGKLFVEGLVLGGGDNSGGKYQAVVTASDLNASPGGNSAFNRMDYSILMGNPDDINTAQCLIGCAGVSNTPAGLSSPGNGGRGMWTVGLGYSMKVAEKTTFKIGAGYLAAVKKLQTDTLPGLDTDMGTEFNANINYNIMKGLDFGLYAAYAMIGDFFVTAGQTDPDSVYDLHFRLNYAF